MYPLRSLRWSRNWARSIRSGSPTCSPTSIPTPTPITAGPLVRTDLGPVGLRLRDGVGAGSIDEPAEWERRAGIDLLETIGTHRRLLK